MDLVLTAILHGESYIAICDETALYFAGSSLGCATVRRSTFLKQPFASQARWSEEVRRLSLCLAYAFGSHVLPTRF
jgi:hypothetical protein